MTLYVAVRIFRHKTMNRKGRFSYTIVLYTNQ